MLILVDPVLAEKVVAAVGDPGVELSRASLVGDGAQIGRDYSLPSALRLRVGPGADIQLS